MPTKYGGWNYQEALKRGQRPYFGSSRRRELLPIRSTKSPYTGPGYAGYEPAGQMQIRQLPGGGLGGTSWRGLLQERLRGGGTQAAESAFRRGISEATKRAIRDYERTVARQGWRPDPAEILKIETHFGKELARGLAGIKERSIAEALRLAMSRRPVTARVRVSTRGYGQRQAREAEEDATRWRAYIRWLEEDEYGKLKGM